MKKIRDISRGRFEFRALFLFLYRIRFRPFGRHSPQYDHTWTPGADIEAQARNLSVCRKRTFPPSKTLKQSYKDHIL